MGLPLAVALLAALLAIIAWQTQAGLAHIDRMMAERSGTLTRMVATEVRNVARYGAARLERVDDVLREVAASPDVAGVRLERVDGRIEIAHGRLPAKLPRMETEYLLVGSSLVRARPLRIETQGCVGCGGHAAGGGRAACGGSAVAQPCDPGCPSADAAVVAGDYRVTLAVDAVPYLDLRRTVWLQGGAGVVLVLCLAVSLWVQQREARRSSTMREALAVADERARSFERLGLVAGGLAHEIKNPLGSLRGFAQLIAERAAPGSKDAEYASLMVSELDAITRRVDRLRDFARPSPPQLAPGRPADVVRRVAALLEPDLAARKVALDLDLPGPDVRDGMIDADRFRDLVVNLVINAVEASPEGGTVRVRLRDGVRDGQVVLEVEDEGPGIPIEQRELALRPFHSTKPGGLGLGLPVAQQVAEDHGGKLEILDATGGGALVRVAWPRDHGARA